MEVEEIEEFSPWRSMLCTQRLFDIRRKSDPQGEIRVQFGVHLHTFGATPEACIESAWAAIWLIAKDQGIDPKGLVES